MQKIKLKHIITVAIVIAVFGSIGAELSTDKNFKIVKNLELFNAAFREVNLLYVDEIDPDKVIKNGIDGMLSELDPYTDYLPEEDVEDFDLATTGEYSGIGALIRAKGDYIQISETYKDFPADKAGLVAGDEILAINGASLKGKKTEEASNMLKGAQGTPVELKIAKLVSKDTVNLKLLRDKVRISGVTYFGKTSGDVGYIMLSSFTQGCEKDFKNALKQLKKENIKSLIIDLRGNTGGLLSSAVDIVGFFVPKGTEVVHARGRIKDYEYSYKTTSEPIDTQIPIVVLVNSGSASSSEIVAGSLQDLDRAAIIGTRTFGKGLVQSVRPLGYNAKIKITTAKYYIPSGRCIQAHNFSKRNEDGSVSTIPDSLKKEFKTASGRKVYDGGGILPDIVLKPETYSDIAVTLAYQSLFTDYSIQYYAQHPNGIGNPENFSLSDSDYADFINFLSNKTFDYKTQAELDVDKLIESTKKGKYSEEIQNEAENLKDKIKHNKNNDLQTNKEELKHLLTEEIASRYYYQQGRSRVMLTYDKQVQKALELLSNTEKYKNILAVNK